VHNPPPLPSHAISLNLPKIAAYNDHFAWESRSQFWWRQLDPDENQPATGLHVGCGSVHEKPR
jgi:hypothetical protein